MKKICTVLFLSCLLGSMSFAQVKIGLPSGPPQASAVLDLSNTGDGTRAFILPRVASTASILTPANGMLIYDISSGCTKVYDNGAWSSCLSQAASGAGVNCASSALNGNYNQGTASTVANTVTIVVINNTSTALTITPSITDIALSGVGAAGLTVASVLPASVSPAVGGGTSTITYTLTGTPTAAGAFTATFTKLGLTCAKTGNVCLAIAPITVTNTTNPATLPIPTVAGNAINFVAAGGTPNTSLTWAMTSNPATGVFSSPATGTGATAQAILLANASGLVTVTYTAANACGLTVTGTQGVAVSDLSVNATTSAINGYYSQNTALTAANTVTVVLVNNSTIAKTITPLTADVVLSGAGAAGITVASFSPASVPVAANGGTSTITYTLSGTPTTLGSFTVTWNKVGLNLVKTSTVCLAIAPIGVSNITSPSTLPYPTVAGNTISFTATGGIPNTTGMSWVMTSSPAGLFSNPASGTGNTPQAVLIAGAYGAVTVTFSVENACGLVVTGTQIVYLDALRSALNAGGCTSCAAYDAAAANTWVSITAAEYAQINNFVSTNIAAATETIMSVGSTSPWSQDYTVTQTGANINTLPANNFVVAFSAINANGGTVSNAYVKYSTAAATNYTVGGAALKIPATSGRIYNIMKTPSAVVNASSASYVGLYVGTGAAWLGSGTFASTSSYYNTGDVANIGTAYSECTMYQIKATATKKW